MRSISAIAFVLMIGELLAPCYACGAGNESAAEVVQWSSHSDFEDGRRFLSDGGMVLDARYVPTEPIPEKTVPPRGVQNLLQSKTTHEFSLSDLDRASGHYMAPGSVQLNRKYIDFLRKSSLKSSLRFKASAPNSPVLILDSDKVVGVMMPMKSMSDSVGAVPPQKSP